MQPNYGGLIARRHCCLSHNGTVTRAFDREGHRAACRPALNLPLPRIRIRAVPTMTFDKDRRRPPGCRADLLYRPGIEPKRTALAGDTSNRIRARFVFLPPKANPGIVINRLFAI